jgi:hypothetical protein
LAKVHLDLGRGLEKVQLVFKMGIEELFCGVKGHCSSILKSFEMGE